jgi:acetyltransferase-like isoleucine patch superfamily enzyme
MFPAAAICGFGRVELVFQLFAQATALIPGIVGDYARTAYYFLTLHRSTLSLRISLGSFFAHSDASVDENVYIGAYCVLGRCQIGERTHISDRVQVLSGAHQHGRDECGHMIGSVAGSFQLIRIGADCWLGASSVIMADVGPRATIGAGAVVPRPIPADVVAVGNPARILERRQRKSPEPGAMPDPLAL